MYLKQLLERTIPLDDLLGISIVTTLKRGTLKDNSTHIVEVVTYGCDFGEGRKL